MDRFLGFVKQIRRSRRRKGKKYRPEEDYQEGYEDVYYYASEHFRSKRSPTPSSPPSSWSFSLAGADSKPCMLLYSWMQKIYQMVLCEVLAPLYLVCCEYSHHVRSAQYYQPGSIQRLIL
ncbi:glutamate receptor interacting protein 1 [Cricetulus griseus]|nr:glutamate receptor interacting protein 1 [Cricetulus griseus]